MPPAPSAPRDPLIPQALPLHPLDYAILLVLAIFAFIGFARGFITSTLALIALLATVFASVRWHSALAELLSRALDLPGGLTTVLAFSLIIVAGQIVSALLEGVVGGSIRATLWWSPAFRWADRIGGLLPGVVRGLVVLGLMALVWLQLPLLRPLRDTLSSSLTVPLAEQADRAIPALGRLLERAQLDTPIVAPPPDAASVVARTIDFPRDIALEVDPAGEDAMLQLVNRERAHMGVPPVQMDERLRRVARSHSEEMFRLSYFAHDSPVRGTPFDRIRAYGVPFNVAGENLAYAPNVELAHDGLMKSPDHRRNILSPAFRRIGIGVMRGGTWGRMFTQNFAD